MLEGFDARVQAKLLREVGRQVTGILDTTRDMIRDEVERGINEGLSPGALADNLEDAAAFSEYRAELIARTETATMLNRAALGSYGEFGVTHVEVIDGEGDDECAAANGQIWTLEEADANPIAHPNCVRDFSPVLDGRTGEEAAPAAEPAAEPLTGLEVSQRLVDLNIGGDLSGLDPALSQPVLDAMEALHAQYPDVFDAMSVNIEMRTTDPRAYAATGISTYNGVPQTGAGLWRGQATIHLNVERFQDSELLLQGLGDDYAKGWIGGNDVQHVIDHEFGHILDAARGTSPTLHYHDGPFRLESWMNPTLYGKTDGGERFAEMFAMLRRGAELEGTAADDLLELMAE